ncbi:MAG: hypothetical protein ACOYBS_10800 [Flavobacterium sp.]
MKAYTLKKRRDTEEYHLFEGKFTIHPYCITKQLSICRKMNKTESESDLFKCYNQTQARIRIAKIGSPVCSNCVDYLNTTFGN